MFLYTITEQNKVWLMEGESESDFPLWAKEKSDYFLVEELPADVVNILNNLELQAYKNEMITAVQNALDTQAKKLGYDNVNSIGKYLRPSSIFYEECVNLGDWCDACWQEVFAIENEGVMLTKEEVLQRLPNYE